MYRGRMHQTRLIFRTQMISASSHIDRSEMIGHTCHVSKKKNVNIAKHEMTINKTNKDFSHFSHAG